MENKKELEEVNQGKSIKLSLDGIPESTKEEVLNPPARLIGQAISGIVHAVFDPLVKFNIVRDKDLKDFEKKVKSGTNQIPEKNRDDDKIGLVLKAFEESKYQLDSEEMRVLFANLISSTVDNRKNYGVQPSFSSVLKDMSVEDAHLLKLFAEENAVPLVTIRLENDKGVGTGIHNNILIFNNETYENELSLFSLERLGILSLNSDNELSSQYNKDKYQNLENNEKYLTAKNSLPLVSEEFTFTKVRFQKGNARLTPFGKAFIACVV
ncbi:DUF4393 domain-containing protein [Planococcus rifietoensis]|uniref:DUF4393 domain-containing protein n=1 Tax=Planococcus rifietoensis TaxID=200991 RepID=UPI00384D4857